MLEAPQYFPLIDTRTTLVFSIPSENDPPPEMSAIISFLLASSYQEFDASYLTNNYDQKQIPILLLKFIHYLMSMPHGKYQNCGQDSILTGSSSEVGSYALPYTYSPFIFLRLDGENQARQVHSTTRSAGCGSRARVTAAAAACALHVLVFS